MARALFSSFEDYFANWAFSLYVQTTSRWNSPSSPRRRAIASTLSAATFFFFCLTPSLSFFLQVFLRVFLQKFVLSLRLRRCFILCLLPKQCTSKLPFDFCPAFYMAGLPSAFDPGAVPVVIHCKSTGVVIITSAQRRKHSNSG